MTARPLHMPRADDHVPYEDEEEFEPMLGLPEIPPEDEHILWQGEPSVRAIAQRVFHIGMMVVYFALLFAWSVYDQTQGGASMGAAISGSTILVVPLGFVTFMLFGLAWIIAKTSVYTVTNKRVVMRVGVALSKAVNLPFAQIVALNERVGRDGTVDIALTMADDAQPHYMFLWPHVRPRTWRKVQPMLRGIAFNDPVRAKLLEAISAYHGQEVSSVSSVQPEHEEAPERDIIPGNASTA